MAKIIDTSVERSFEGRPDLTYYTYNGLDCCLTHEILDELLPLLDTNTAKIYRFERDLQAPLLEASRRGIRVNRPLRDRIVATLKVRAEKLLALINRYADAIWDKPLNPGSPDQLQKMFYGRLQIPEIRVQAQGKWRVSTNREALEKMLAYFWARPLVHAILAWRDVTKQIQTLTTGIDPDGRFRTSFNIAGTTTGRLSSSENPFGTGGNVQNITNELRIVLEADPGHKLGYFDLEQAESRAVGLLAYLVTGKDNYLNACEAGDLHTVVAKLCWPHLPWTGDLKTDRALAEEPFYRMFSRRDLSKRGGHGCLTEGHEVLTRKGWVPIESKPAEILTWSSTQGSVFQTVSQWTDKFYTGTLHRWEGTSISLEMTHDHRVAFFPDVRRALVVRSPGEIIRGHVPLGNGYSGGTESVPARLIAAFQADGNQKSKNRMHWHLHKQRKKNRLKEIANAYGYVWNEDFQNQTFTIEGSFPKKPGAYMLNWTSQCIKDYIDELKHWDGHVGTSAVSLFSSDQESLEWIQTLGRIVGVGGNIQKLYTSGFGTAMFALQQNNRQFATIASMQRETLPAQDIRVLCPTVASTFFYVRRNGKISVTGNSNYYAMPNTIARNLKIPVPVATSFVDAYFHAFPEIRLWQEDVIERIKRERMLITPFGRVRQFFGRPTEGATHRAAIAHGPQSLIADLVDSSVLRIWREVPKAQLLLQVHDAVVVQYREEHEAEVVPQVIECMTQRLDIEPFELHTANGRVSVPGRHFRIGSDPMIGWNWGKANSRKYALKADELYNPDGMVKWKNGDKRIRQGVRLPPKPAIDALAVLKQIVP